MFFYHEEQILFVEKSLINCENYLFE